jgi:cell division septal protein FtsQ
MAKDDRPASLRDGLYHEHRAQRRRRSLRGMVTFACFLLLLGGAAFFHAQTSARPLWTVATVEVEGNRSIPTADLLARLRLAPGTPWWRVTRKASERLLASTPRIQKLGLDWRWPRDLHITVRERESVLRLLSPARLELAGDGVLMEPCEALDPVDLPLLTGDLPATLAAGRRCDLPAAGPSWKELLSLGRENPELWKEISEIHYLGNQDFQIFLRNGHKVIFWSAGMNHDMKNQIPTILAELRQNQVQDAVLDLRFRDQAVVRLPAAVEAEREGAAKQPEPAPAPPARASNHKNTRRRA